MSGYEQKDGNGALFKNDRKESDNHPDYKGDCKVGGVDYWISAWIKEGKKGKFMSLALKPKEARDAAPTTRKPNDKDPRDLSDLDSDVPF